MADQNLNPDPRRADQADTSGMTPQTGDQSSMGATQGQQANPTTPIPTPASAQDAQPTQTNLGQAFAQDSAASGSQQSQSDDDFLTTRFDPDGQPTPASSDSSSSEPGYTPAQGYGANPTGSQGAEGTGTASEGQNQNGAGQYGQNPYGGQNTGAGYGYGTNYGQNGGAYGSPYGSGYGQNASGQYGQNPQNGYGAYGYGTGANNGGANGAAGNGNGAGNGGNNTGWSGTGWNNAGFNGNNQAAKPHKKMSANARMWVSAAVAAVVAALLVLAIGWGGIASGLITVPSSSSLSTLNSSGSGSGSANVPTGKSVDWQALNKKVASSVVSIQAQVSNGVAAGSGAVLDTNGNIVTNNHVIEGASQIQVTLSNGNIYEATLVGQDTTTDLAVIKLKNPPKNLTPVTFADSSTLAVGEQIMSIGNPLGYENTATTGIISALNRPVTVSDESTNSEVVTNAVQIDAAINPGNSGGPTFNAAGQVIGINSSIATASSSSSSSSSSSGSIGIGFAIPSNLVKKVANAIIKDGHVDHAQLGITIRSGSATTDGATRAGAQVVTVNAGSVGAKAGLQKGDVIVGFNGNTVSGMYSLLGYVRAASVGDTVKLTVIRDGKTLDLNCTLSDKESTSSSSSSNGNKSQGNGNSNKGNGNSQGNGNNDGNSNGNGNSDDDDSDGFGGLSDPFGWF